MKPLIFSDNDVAVKVISGDNQRQLVTIASQAGVANAEKYIDASTIVTDQQIRRCNFKL